jgi:hypothetical protein
MPRIPPNRTIKNPSLPNPILARIDSSKSVQASRDTRRRSIRNNGDKRLNSKLERPRPIKPKRRKPLSVKLYKKLRKVHKKNRFRNQRMSFT